MNALSVSPRRHGARLCRRARRSRGAARALHRRSGARASPRIICASCASSASTPPMATARPTARACTPASPRARACATLSRERVRMELLKLLRRAARGADAGGDGGDGPAASPCSAACRSSRASPTWSRSKRRSALAPDAGAPARRARPSPIVEDAERLWRAAAALQCRARAPASRWRDGWWRSRRRMASRIGARLLYRLGAGALRRPRAAGLGALAGAGAADAGWQALATLPQRWTVAALSAARGRLHRARRRQGPGARRGACRRPRRPGSPRDFPTEPEIAGRHRRPGGRPAVIQSAIRSALADVSISQLALIAAVGMLTSVLGGVTGYGTGALMPLVLVPIVGAEPVVPIIAISAIITNVEPRARVPPRHRLAPGGHRASSPRSRPASSAPGPTRC